MGPWVVHRASPVTERRWGPPTLQRADQARSALVESRTAGVENEGTVDEVARNDDCDFCAIAAGLQSAEIVCEEPSWLAFFPTSPATRGHTLVVPREHVIDLWHADLALARDVMDGCVKVGAAIRAALRPEGMNLISSAGDVAEQSVFHLHLHVVPRWEDDRIGRIWPPKSTETPVWIPEVAAAVRDAYRST